ncbi:hypothetical protein EYF80_031847 [Liparis tanakae]|uniref:Uncharacterized protein n=1 Tax=Liparis tanakae TaxID=230148 RepID=A0A4Z2GX92_9TELE|nr:hypothetical protein EYF80_031847 [Liparis tanakae]
MHIHERNLAMKNPMVSPSALQERGGAPGVPVWSQLNSGRNLWRRRSCFGDRPAPSMPSAPIVRQGKVSRAQAICSSFSASVTVQVLYTSTPPLFSSRTACDTHTAFMRDTAHVQDPFSRSRPEDVAHHHRGKVLHDKKEPHVRRGRNSAVLSV